MSKYVKISNLSLSPCPVAANLKPQIAVNLVLEHLHSKVKLVLPDQPDLILFSSNYWRWL